MAIHPGDLTVIVPTRNEERNIGNFLGSIPEGIRLVVVDASTDSTPDIVSRRARIILHSSGIRAP